MVKTISFFLVAALFGSGPAMADLESDLQGKHIGELFSCAIEPANPTSIELSKNALSCAERKLITQDLTWLKQLKLEKHDPDLAKLLGVESISTEILLQWIEQRVHYLYNGNRHNSTFSKELTGPIPVFPNSHLPFTDYVEEPQATPGTVAKMFGITGASNQGAAIFVNSKQSGYLYDFLSPEGISTQILSPRVGIVSVEGLFAISWYPNPEEPKATINSIFRLGILFHEARHSDGAGRHIGFLHNLCPDGSDYAAQGACDDTLNGAYTIGVHVMNELMMNCKECPQEDIGALQILMANQLIRVIKEIPVSQYAVDQATLLCDAMAAPDPSEANSERRSIAISECRENLNFLKSVRHADWADPTPEYLTLSKEHHAPPEVLLPDLPPSFTE